MRTKPAKEEIENASIWYLDHREHVDELTASTTDMFAPSGSDRFHPELWKAAHWNWYFSGARIV